MSDAKSNLTYTIKQNEGTWFQLWWDGEECVCSEDLKATTRDGAEQEAALIATSGSPFERVMEAMGCTPAGSKAAGKE